MHPTRPSFAYSIASANRRKDYPAVDVVDKRTCRRLLRAYHAPVPEPHKVIGPLAALEPGMLLEPRVVKPVHGRDSVGVAALVPRAEGGWHDVLRRRSFTTFDELIADLGLPLREERIKTDRWVVEELLLPPDGTYRPVDDIKVYAFRGVVACTMIVAKDAPKKRYRWFDPDWRPIDVGQYAAKTDGTIGPPPHAEEIRALAGRLSQEVPLPFVRVDCYDTSRGPVVGELTPLPGGHDKFSEEWDERLGTMYEYAESTLIREVSRWRRTFGLRPWMAVRGRARQIRSHTDVAAHQWARVLPPSRES